MEQLIASRKRAATEKPPSSIVRRYHRRIYHTSFSAADSGMALSSRRNLAMEAAKLIDSFGIRVERSLRING
ncbi:MAG: hypothetical protein U0744_19090 [Gemmataceae bacterium]